MSASSGLAQFKLTYQISPIFFVGGVAGNLPTSAIPITSYTQGQNFPGGPLQAGTNLDPNAFFANFVLESGSTLIENEIATYPVVNLAVAANAYIAQPLRLALRMICPVGASGSYTRKQSTMTALINTISQHIALGGTFTVATPAYLYTGCILEALRDASPPVDFNSSQIQFEYIWSFMQPLVSAAQAQQAENTQMARIANQTQNSGDPPGSQPIVNAVGSASPPNSGALFPAASGSAAGTIAPPQGS